MLFDVCRMCGGGLARSKVQVSRRGSRSKHRLFVLDLKDYRFCLWSWGCCGEGGVRHGMEGMSQTRSRLLLYKKE